MFGKRSAQPGVAVAPRPAPAPQPAAQARVLDAVDAFSIEELEAAARPPSDAADRLDALAARPRTEAPAPTPGGPVKGPRATAGLEQLKKAQAVAEIVREQADYYHATKTTIFNALMNTIDPSQLAQLDTNAGAD